MAEPFSGLHADWPAAANIRTLVTTRVGGTSLGPYASLNLGLKVDDEPAAVAANRQRLRAQLPAEPLWLHQVHGNAVVAAHAAVPDCAADGAWTDRPDTVCAVMIADCLPVLLCDRAGQRVGVAHAGWRGLAAGVIENTVSAMQVPGREMLAWLGPAIGPDAFEVGAEVRAAMVAHDPAASIAFRERSGGKYLADLYALARLRLLAAGVTAVYGGGLCTHTDSAQFFSFRRDRVTGRMAALIWIAPRQ